MRLMTRSSGLNVDHQRTYGLVADIDCRCCQRLPGKRYPYCMMPIASSSRTYHASVKTRVTSTSLRCLSLLVLHPYGSCIAMKPPLPSPAQPAPALAITSFRRRNRATQTIGQIAMYSTLRPKRMDPSWISTSLLSSACWQGT